MVELLTGDDSSNRRGGNMRIEIIPNNSRDQNTLLEIITMAVMTDLWKGYMNLNGLGARSGG